MSLVVAEPSLKGISGKCAGASDAAELFALTKANISSVIPNCQVVVPDKYI